MGDPTETSSGSPVVDSLGDDFGPPHPEQVPDILLQPWIVIPVLTIVVMLIGSFVRLFSLIVMVACILGTWFG